MPVSPTSAPSLPTDWITAAFPFSLKSKAAELYEVMGNIPLATHGAIEVRVGGDDLSIPYRIYDHGEEDACESLSGVKSIMYSCLLTRHHDGFVRQRQLERILSVQEPWIVPFVFQLTGEYVVEILHACETLLPRLQPSLYGTFIRDNPEYVRTTRQRMISYWDCYYRTHGKHLPDYVGFRLFERFRQFAEGM